MAQDKRTDRHNTRNSLNMRSIFRCMMEGGYYPKYEGTHILFNLEDNVAVVEYEEGILSIRIFFSIDEAAYDMFLLASNSAMIKSFIVKPAVLDDMRNIMFSCELICGNVREFRKFFPLGIRYLNEALAMHRMEMRKLMLSEITESKVVS